MFNFQIVGASWKIPNRMFAWFNSHCIQQNSQICHPTSRCPGRRVNYPGPESYSG